VLTICFRWGIFQSLFRSRNCELATPKGSPYIGNHTTRSTTSRTEILTCEGSILGKRDDLFDKLGANLPGVLYVFRARSNGEFCFDYISRRMNGFSSLDIKALGATPELVVERIHKDDRLPFLRSLKQSRLNLTVFHQIVRAFDDDGEMKWFKARSGVERDSNGDTVWYGYLIEVTGEMETQESLRRQRDTLHRLAYSPSKPSQRLRNSDKLTEGAVSSLDIEGAGCWEINSEKQILECLAFYRKESGQDSELVQVERARVSSFLEVLRERKLFITNDLGSEPLQAELSELCCVEETVGLLVAGLFLDGELSGFLTFHHSQTDRSWTKDEVRFAKSLENWMRKLEIEAIREEDRETLNRLSESVPGFLFQYQMWPDGSVCFPFASQGVQEIYEFTPEEIMEDASKAFERFHPEDLERIFEIVQESFDRQTIWNDSFRVILPKAGVRWLTGRARPEKQSDGSTLWHGYIFDETERFKADQDRRELELRLEQSQRLESLGVLAGGLAHDFNNLLMAIRGNAELLGSEFSPGSSQKETLQDILAATQSASELTSQMLSFAKRSAVARSSLDIHALLSELISFLKASLPKQIELAISNHTEDAWIVADPGQLRQVFLNLVVNGSEAIGERPGKVAVTVSKHHFENGEPELSLPPGDYLEVIISDNGVGMDQETRDRIYEPFYTSKFTGRGLGLATVIGIVSAHEGSITCDSALGEGTEFRVLLPVGEPEPVLPPESPGPRKFRWQGRVLVVDDEAPVRNVVCRMLRNIGCEVWTAENGLVALEKYDQLGDCLDLVLMDLTMPKMDGAETLRRLQERAPDLPVVICSGYSEDHLTNRLPKKAIRAVLTKPFTLDDLTSTLRNIFPTA
jgi:signal transduction histidine kinase/CheY-like chemotaxis protein